MSVKLTLGVSLKMYFGFQQTLDWSRQVADIVRHHPLWAHRISRPPDPARGPAKPARR